VTQRAEQRSVEVSGVAGRVEIGADALRDIGVDGKRVAPAAFPHDAQRIESAILMEVLHRERGYFRAAEANLHAHRENRAIA
jgi:hypothetical protein